jgi:hypothetical protein
LILKKLDEKFKYIDLTKNLAHKGKVLYEEVYQSSRIHDGAISSWLISEEHCSTKQGFRPTYKEKLRWGLSILP